MIVAWRLPRSTVLVLVAVAQFCERAVVFGGGRILLDGPVRDVFAETEMLARTVLKVPQIARFSLARELPRAALTVDEASELLDAAATPQSRR